MCSTPRCTRRSRRPSQPPSAKPPGSGARERTVEVRTISTRRLPVAAFLLACAVNLYAVYWPTEPAPTGGIPHIDKLAHFGIFALVAFTGRWAGIRLRWLAPLLVVQSVGSEIIQGTLESSGRDGSAFDAVADLIGSAAGLAVWALARRRQRASDIGRLGSEQ